MRNVTTAFKNALAADTVRPAILVSIATKSPGLSFYYSTTPFDLSWNSITWTGDGTLRGIGDLSENLNDVDTEIEIYLGGSTQAMMSLILLELGQGNAVSVYLALFDSSGAIIADPHCLLPGQLQEVSLEDEAETATVTLTVSSLLGKSRSNGEFRYNDATQRFFYPNDEGFKFVPQMAEWNGWWGTKVTKTKNETASKNRAKRTRAATAKGRG